MKPGKSLRLELAHPIDFDGWRQQARELAERSVPADVVRWTIAGEQTPSLLGTTTIELPITAPGNPIKVPRSFVELAQRVVLHRDPGRFVALYKVLLRLRNEPRLMEVAVDSDVACLAAMERAVDHDIHRMHAYVRFRRVAIDNGERFVAWYEPEHFIVEASADFFARRFAGQHWAILTPDRSVAWNGEELRFGPGVARAAAPDGDALENLWRTYYASIFNPARLNRTALQAHLPRRFWSQLPEAQLIEPLAATARARAGQMVATEAAAPRRSRKTPLKLVSSTGGTDAVAHGPLSKGTVDNCRRCPLWKHATQGVPGEGPTSAQLMLVGEQPGDQEDLAGRPFVGPAGQLLDRALEQAGIDRAEVYVTNAVKHFKYELRGKRRLHKKPSEIEIETCNTWLQQEIESVAPRLIVALGATALRALTGRALPVQANRGQLLALDDGRQMLVTVHPSFLLRVPPETRDDEYAKFVADLKVAVGFLARERKAR